MSEPDMSESHEYWEGHWFNPVAFTQQWYEDHPEVLDKMIADEERMARLKKEGP